MRKVAILVGTMTGTAELAAGEVQSALAGAGVETSVLLMDDLTAAVFAPETVYLICTSTYGSGDVPDNAQALLEDLESSRPDLSGVSYGLIALGDRTYKATFCFGGLTFDRVLRELGATRLGELLLHDASEGTLAEDVAVGWAMAWLDEQLSALADVA
jgi:MioC protein